MYVYVNSVFFTFFLFFLSIILNVYFFVAVIVVKHYYDALGVGSCIGYYNQKIFFLFLFYAVIAITFSCIWHVIQIAKSFSKKSGHDVPVLIQLAVLILIGSFCLALCKTLFFFFFATTFVLLFFVCFILFTLSCSPSTLLATGDFLDKHHHV